jgi:hypothetical protein
MAQVFAIRPQQVESSKPGLATAEHEVFEL